MSRRHSETLTLLPLALLGGAFLSLFACGGPSWLDSDTAASQTGARMERRILEICAPEVEDAGTCTPARVRSLADLAYCANVRQLVTHRQPVPDGGEPCQPQQ